MAGLEFPMGWPDMAVLPETSTFIVMVPDGDQPYMALPVPGGPIWNPEKPGPVGPPDTSHQIMAYQMAHRISGMKQYQNHWVAVWCDYIPYAWCPVAFRNGENQTKAYYRDDAGGGWNAEEIASVFDVPKPLEEEWDIFYEAGVPEDTSPPAP